MANSRAAIGVCWRLRRSNLVGRPIPFHFRLGKGAWPGGHTLTDDWIPTTYS
jgi:hypothetical protein